MGCLGSLNLRGCCPKGRKQALIHRVRLILSSSVASDGSARVNSQPRGLNRDLKHLRSPAVRFTLVDELKQGRV